MARIAFTSIQEITRDGLEVSYQAASAEMSFTNTNENVWVHVKNSSGGLLTITIITSREIDGLSVTDRTVTVADGTEKFIGPFKNSDYGNSTQTVYFDFDATTSVTAAAMKLGST